MSFDKEQRKTRPTLIDVNPVELNYYPVMISLDTCNRSCNTLTEILGRIYVPNKTENVNMIFFNLITRTNESKK